MAVEYTCPYCHEPVTPSAPDAMMIAATQQWQHRDCWTPRSTPPSPRQDVNLWTHDKPDGLAL
jgi:hypothetical protein